METDIDKSYKAEIDKRLAEMEYNPQPGYTLQDVLREVEEELGRKIKTRTFG